MSRDDHTTDDEQRRERRVTARLAAIVFSAGLLLLAVHATVLDGTMGAGGVTVAEGATSTPIYGNETVTPDTGGWLSGHTDRSIPSLLGLVIKTLSALIGIGSIAGGGGAASSLILGFLVVGMGVGATSNSGVGTVGGPVAGVGLSFAVFQAGLVPGWLYALELMAVGLVTTAAYLRVTR